MKDILTRREALKAIGVAGSLTTTGVLTDQQTPYGTVRLIEAGIEYDLPNGYNYNTYHLDGQPMYHVGADGTRLFLTRSAPASVRRLFAKSDVITSGDRVTGTPGVLTNTRPTKGVTTKLASGARPVIGVALAESHTKPTIEIRRLDQTPVIATKTVEKEVTSDLETSHSVKPREITAETRHVLDERVDDESVPMHERALKTEYRDVQVEAVPKVRIRDHGELTVMDVPDARE